MISVLSENGAIPKPWLNGKLMEMQDRTSVILLEKELFDAPMIMYHCEYEGIHVRIRASYISVFDLEKTETKMDIAKFIDMVDPGFPNPDNYAQFDYVNTIEDKMMTIGNQSVLARVVKANEGWYDKIHFLYNGFYVQIEAPDLLKFDEAFFEGFSIE